MKKCCPYFILCGFLTIFQNLHGTEYYVSTTGSDSNPGTLAAPWQTIQKAANTMVAGDISYIREGTYRESVVPAQSGSDSHPITYVAYPGETVVINGCDPVSGLWTVDSGNVYTTNVTLTLGHENQVFANGTEMVWEARWPDVGTTSLNGLLEFVTATMKAGTIATKIVDTTIPNYDWTGGTVWVSSNRRWSAWTGAITGFAPGEISLVDASLFDGNTVCKAGGLYYVFGVRDALDSANEWFYDETQGELYLWVPGGGAPSGVEVKVREYGFDLSDRNHIRLERLNFFATSINTSSTSDSLELDSLDMQHVYHSSSSLGQASGLVLRGNNHKLTNSEIAYSSGTGVYLGDSGHWVVNNYIHDHDYIGSYASPLVLRGRDFVVSNNTLSRAGRQVVQFGEIYGSLFQYNRVSHAGYLTWDLGLIYGNSIAGGNAEVRYNWFHDNLASDHGNGIYYDHGCKNIITHHNVVWNISKSPIAHNQYANYLLWYNNTGSTSGENGIRSAWNAAQDKDLHGTRYFNNVLSGTIYIDASDYTEVNNFTEYTQLIDNRYLAPATDPIDAATPLAGITDGWVGAGPDAGAYETGGPDWIPGHDFASPPTSINTTRSLPRHRNLLVNASFEAGTLAPWVSIGSTTTLRTENNKSQWIVDGTTLMGGYSAALGAGQTGISQVINGLEPDTEYEIMGKFRVDAGESAYLGVRNHGGTEQTGTLVTDTANLWQKSTIKFHTGLNSTTAEVFAFKDSTGPGTVYFEDAGVQLQDPYIVSDNFEASLDQWVTSGFVSTDAGAQSPVDNAGEDTFGARLIDDTTTLTSLQLPIAPDNRDTLYVQYDFRYTGSVVNPGFQIKAGTLVGINLHMVDTIGELSYKEGSAWQTTGIFLEPDTWYRFTLSVQPVNSVTDSFDLRIQKLDTGTPLDVVLIGLGFQNELNDVDTARFHFNIPASDRGGQYDIDNVLITNRVSWLNLLVDTDRDGIDDDWERLHFGDLATATAVSDYDRDGVSDLQEYLQGTDPLYNENYVKPPAIQVSSDIGALGALLLDTSSTSTYLEKELTIPSDSALRVQFDYLYRDSVNNSGMVVFNSTGQRGINLHMTTSSQQLQVNQAGSWTTLTSSLQPDTWYRFTLNINPANSAVDQFSLIVHSLDPSDPLDIEFAGLRFQDTSTTQLNKLRFHFNISQPGSSGGTYYLDNLLVTEIPTASSASTLFADEFETDLSDWSVVSSLIQDALAQSPETSIYRQVSLSWLSETDRIYRVLYSPDLTNGWSDISGPITGTPPENAYSVKIPTDLLRSFFRIEREN